MPGLVRPRSFPIRRITDVAQRLGRILNPRRMPDHGGFTAMSKWESTGEFKVEAPTSTRTAEESNRKSDT